MSGKKGLSGPPGNINNSKRPWNTFWRRKALRKEDRWILPTLEAYPNSLLSDKPDASEAERRLIEVAQIARGASMLILAECANHGFITKENGTWDLAPGAKELAKFLGIERASLQSLGLGRRAKSVMQLTDYIEAKKQQDGSSS